jgi:DNA-binding transcriptional LysR family regulator
LPSILWTGQYCIPELLKRTDESVERVRALARGEYGELHVGFGSVSTAEILPSVLAVFRKAVPRVKVLLHDLSNDELITGLQNGTLELAIMVQLKGAQTAGIEFELLRTHPLCVALTATHPFTRLKICPVAEGRLPNHSSDSAARIIPEYYRNLDRIFARATKGDLTTAGEKFCEILRKTSAARVMPER